LKEPLRFWSDKFVQGVRAFAVFAVEFLEQPEISLTLQYSC